tara:strand:- start:310 stop:810 length:501 start_codon:yes stop_codon:yes gene_type:complete
LINLKEIKNKIFTRNNIYSLFIISVIFFLDRYTKIFILNNFSDNLFYLNDFINFDLVWNTGIGFGLFSSTSNLIYHSITGLIGTIVIFIIYLINKSTFIDKIFFSMILGGALGNFYDRIVYSAVPDFIDIHYERFHWFTFNIADIFITFGVLLLVAKELFLKNGKN